LLAILLCGYLIDAMLKISRCQAGEDTVEFALSGRLQFMHVNELRELIRKEEQKVVLNLHEVNLLDREAVEFLVACEREGVSLRKCSPYIREWITREASRQNSPAPREEG
jgi:aryl-alcohol dehydrogenase-like predicted oxidoreductase